MSWRERAVRTALVGRRQGGNRMIRIQLACDACGRQSDHHTPLGLNLRDDRARRAAR